MGLGRTTVPTFRDFNQCRWPRWSRGCWCSIQLWRRPVYASFETRMTSKHWKAIHVCHITVVICTKYAYTCNSCKGSVTAAVEQRNANKECAQSTTRLCSPRAPWKLSVSGRWAPLRSTRSTSTHGERRKWQRRGGIWKNVCAQTAFWESGRAQGCRGVLAR